MESFSEIFQSEWIKVLWSKHKYCISLLGCLTGKHSRKYIFTTIFCKMYFQEGLYWIYCDTFVSHTDENCPFINPLQSPFRTNCCWKKGISIRSRLLTTRSVKNGRNVTAKKWLHRILWVVRGESCESYKPVQIVCQPVRRVWWTGPFYQLVYPSSVYNAWRPKKQWFSKIENDLWLNFSKW